MEGRVRHLWIVDDEPSWLECVTDAFSCFPDIAVSTFGAPMDLILGLMSTLEPPDLIITDNQMPGMTGLMMAARIREAWPGQKILLLTGDTDLTEGPVDKILYKPIGLEPLRKEVLALLPDP